jgi:hypothetical protein
MNTGAIRSFQLGCPSSAFRGGYYAQELNWQRRLSVNVMIVSSYGNAVSYSTRRGTTGVVLLLERGESSRFSNVKLFHYRAG